MPWAARPQLRVVGGGLDKVVRGKRVEDAHPESVITPPKTQALWTAGRDGKTLASEYHLGALLDTLGRCSGSSHKSPPSPQEQ